MSKRDYVRAELADIEQNLAGRAPETIGEDMSDLAVIGLARYDPKITPKQITKLVTAARNHGRSWEQIGSRLGMSGDEACKAYGKPSNGLRDAAVTGGLAGAALLALRHLLRGLGRIPRLALLTYA